MAQKPEKDVLAKARVDRLAGSIDRFTFRNEDSGFAVVRFVPDDGSGPVQAVGQLAQLVEGQKVSLSGMRGVHPRFGPQIEVEAAEASLPQSVDGIKAYLASSLVKGIGSATAARITNAFGADTLRVIEEEPERLREVKGLGRKRIDDLTAAVRAQKEVQEVMVFLRTHGLGQALAVRIVKRFGSSASSLIQANPYRLADEVIGIGFKTADRLAMNLGLAADAPERIQAGVLHCLKTAAGEGHCFLPEPALADRAAQLLECAPEQVTAQLQDLAATGRIVHEDGRVLQGSDDDAATRIYPLALHTAELGAARLLQRLRAAKQQHLPIDANRALAWFEQRSEMALPDAQRQAVLRALNGPVSVITGGPGVGKTTIIRAIADILSAKGLRLLLAAPTGRAAKRLEESTGKGARTIHRLLEYQPGVGRFLRDEAHPLEGDVLVVDEASMLDVQLGHALLRAVPPGMRLCLCGDVDQLPAVGPGNVLGDIIESRIFPVTELTTIFRQQGRSWIVTSAHAVRAGEVPVGGGEGSDFFVVHARDGEHARALVRELVTRRIPKAFGLDPVRDVQVLCPMYRGGAGADAINRDLQDTLNPTSAGIERAGRTFRPGDKVMQIKNDYDLDVFNGDTGRIAHIDERASRVVVDYGDRPVEYPFADLDQLVPAYAITVHRSQGSEYPAVVIPVLTEHFLMLRRNLLYTAITRGKRLVVLVGSPEAIGMAVRNHDEARRYSGLCARLRAAPE